MQRFNRESHRSLVVVMLAFFLCAAGLAQEQLPDFSQMRLLDVEPSAPPEIRRSIDTSAESSLARNGALQGGDLQRVPSAANSSNAPVMCSGPYVFIASDDECWEWVPNENYLAVLTRRSSMFTPTGIEVQDWLDMVDGNFQLAWSSLQQPPMPNASEPRMGVRHSTPNATSAPGDLHIFYRSGLGASIEGIIDGLVSQRVDDWYFSPLVKIQRNYRGGSQLWGYHEFFVPTGQIRAQRWPLTDFRQLIPRLQAALPAGAKLERTTSRRGGTERFDVYPLGRDGLDWLATQEEVESLPEVFSVWQYTRSFLLPGDDCSPCGGPSGGPGGGGTTAVPVSSAMSRAVLIFGLILTGLYWMRRQI